MGNKTAADTSRELEIELEQALANPNEIFGYARYGDGEKWSNWDNMTGGIQPNNLSVLAARPKRGKSMLASAWVPLVAQQAMAEGKIVRVVTLEMKRKSYQRRMAAILAGIKDPMNIRRGMLDEEERERYLDALKLLSCLPIEYLSNEEDLTEKESMIQGNSSVTFKDVQRFIGPDTFWWVLDHIGLLSDLSEYGDVTTSIYSLANKLANLAHRRATGLVITHLTRASTGAMPTIESIAGSDQVGRNADQIFLLSRPFMDAPDLSDEDKKLTEEGEPAFLQAYSRDEGSGIDVLWWDKKLASFDELSLPPDATIPVPKKKKKAG